MITTEEMIRINREQARFYDTIQDAELHQEHRGYAENKASNVLTRLWADMRYRQQEAVRRAGVEQRKETIHHEWVNKKRGGDFLEIGCFSGSVFSFQLIEAAGKYLGVELSSRAVDILRSKIAAKGLTHKADARAMDFLLLPETAKFDVVYAHGVLHHFQNSQPLFAKIARLLKPDGVLVFTEPSTINPVYRLLRALYRPFQSDRAWEWPFTVSTVKTMESFFAPVQGFGWGRWSLPVSVLINTPVVGRWLVPLYVRLVRMEVEAGWHGAVWHNSYVTALYRLRESQKLNAPGGEPSGRN